VQSEQYLLNKIFVVKTGGVCTPTYQSAQRRRERGQELMVGARITLLRSLHEHGPVPLAISAFHSAPFLSIDGQAGFVTATAD
jgi:hypothetical protein